MQDASEQRPHKLSYHLGAKGEEAEKARRQRALMWDISLLDSGWYPTQQAQLCQLAHN